LELPYLAGNSEIVAGIVPASPYEGMVVHQINIYNTPPNVIELNLQQTEVAASTITLSQDVMSEQGIPVWIWVDAAHPLQGRITNRTPLPVWFAATLHTLVFRSLEEMDRIRRLAAKEFGYPTFDLQDEEPFPGRRRR
jgi:hypothetical protein